MSLPYDLDISLFLQSFILGPFLISNSPDEFGLGYMTNEEVEVKRQIVRTIIAGNSDSLQPNYSEPITIRGHNIGVRCHHERGSDYWVWEWHGHVMTYDEMNSYSLEYIHGYYYDRMLKRNG